VLAPSLAVTGTESDATTGEDPLDWVVPTVAGVPEAPVRSAEDAEGAATSEEVEFPAARVGEPTDEGDAGVRPVITSDALLGARAVAEALVVVSVDGWLTVVCAAGATTGAAVVVGAVELLETLAGAAGDEIGAFVVPLVIGALAVPLVTGALCAAGAALAVDVVAAALEPAAASPVGAGGAPAADELVPADAGEVAGVAGADEPAEVPAGAVAVVAEASVVGAVGAAAAPEDVELVAEAEGVAELGVTTVVAPDVEAGALGEGADAAGEVAPAAAPAPEPEAEVEVAPEAEVELVPEAEVGLVLEAGLELAPAADVESADELADDVVTPLLDPAVVLAPPPALVAAPEAASAAACGPPGLLGDGVGVVGLEDWIGTVAGATGGVIPDGGATGLCAAGIAGTGTVVSTTVGAVDTAPTRPWTTDEPGTGAALPGAPGVCCAGIELVSTGTRCTVWRTIACRTTLLTPTDRLPVMEPADDAAGT
jgi:hypothetical protein